MAAQNVDMKVDGKKLIITVDTTKDLGPSKSGKTNMVGTTGGFVEIGGVQVSLNVTKKG